MGNAAVAALLMSPVHAVFGLHIVRRGLIFIDLAIAQVAALGFALACAIGNAPDSTAAYQISVGFALAGALLISVTRFRLGRVPHEAIIGIVYVLATAAAIVILEFAPTGHGLEELKQMLAGNILFVSRPEIETIAWIYGVIFVVALALWREFSSITFNKPGYPAWRMILFDFIYYSLLGFVVASSVKVAGVLVVFTWLVMPAVVAFFFVERMLPAVFIAVAVGAVGSLAGLMLSLKAPPLEFTHGHGGPHPIEAAGEWGWSTGPSIVLAVGALVVVAYLVRLFMRDCGKGADGGS